MTVVETFFSVEVRDMRRATAFYVDALGADVAFASPAWSSLRIAGVRLGLALSPACAGSRVGLHFAVDDLDQSLARVERAGGRVAAAPAEIAPGVTVAYVADPDGNVFALNRR
jgi:predicted enzyme related to lactoylglutathione lyase